MKWDAYHVPSLPDSFLTRLADASQDPGRRGGKAVVQGRQNVKLPWGGVKGNALSLPGPWLSFQLFNHLGGRGR